MFYAPQSYASAGPSLFDFLGAGQQRPYASSPYHYDDDEYDSDPYEDEYLYSPYARQPRQQRKPEVQYLRDPYTGQIYARPVARKAPQPQPQPKRQSQEYETQYFRDPYTGQIYARQVPVKRAASPRAAAQQPAPKPQAQAQAQRQQQPKKEELWVPALDVYSTPTHLTLHFALPGLRKDDLELEYDPRSDRLYIGGVIHSPQQHSSSSTSEIKERKVGKFERVVELERYLDEEEDVGKRFAHEGVEAKVEDGIVEIRVPKVEVRKQRVW
ncbi:hypothetical protein YB2330_005078 [Saitoella coloradoensis]